MKLYKEGVDWVFFGCCLFLVIRLSASFVVRTFTKIKTDGKAPISKSITAHKESIIQVVCYHLPCSCQSLNAINRKDLLENNQHS